MRATNQVQRFVYGNHRCFESLGDKNTILQNFILDQLHGPVITVSRTDTLISLQDITRQAFCNCYQFRFNKITIICTANYFEY